jgi:hypothetical protein
MAAEKDPLTGAVINYFKYGAPPSPEVGHMREGSLWIADTRSIGQTTMEKPAAAPPTKTIFETRKPFKGTPTFSPAT